MKKIIFFVLLGGLTYGIYKAYQGSDDWGLIVMPIIAIAGLWANKKTKP